MSNKLVEGFHHIGFVVEDLDRTIDFYTNKLGFKVSMRWFESDEQINPGMGIEGSSLELAQLVGYGVMLEFTEFLTSAGNMEEQKANQKGNAHLSFTVYDLPTVIEKLTKKEVPFVSDRMIVPEFKITWVKIIDPDGIQIEIMQFFPTEEDVK